MKKSSNKDKEGFGAKIEKARDNLSKKMSGTKAKLKKKLSDVADSI